MPGIEDWGPLTVAVLGCCMTRDAFNSRFNPDYRTWYRVPYDQNQPALPALLSPPVPVDEADLAGLDEWNTTRVRDDFARRILGDLAAAPPDYLLVDFGGDIRYGILRVDGERWVTNTRMAVAKTPWYERHAAAGAPETLSALKDPDAYVAAWTTALNALDAHLRRHAPATQVVLVRARHQRLLVTARGGRRLPLAEHRAMPRLDVDAADAAWERLDEAALALPGWRSIDLRGRDYPTSDAHPWGAGYLHFSPDYYADLLAGLHAVHLERAIGRGEPEPPGMAAFVAARASDPARGRPWDDEPGRGHLPVVRLPRQRFARLAGLRQPVHRFRRRLRAALTGLGLRSIAGS